MTSLVKKISTLLFLILCLTLPDIKAARRTEEKFELTDKELKANYEKYIVLNLAKRFYL